MVMKENINLKYFNKSNLKIYCPEQGNMVVLFGLILQNAMNKMRNDIYYPKTEVWELDKMYFVIWNNKNKKIQ